MKTMTLIDSLAQALGAPMQIGSQSIGDDRIVIDSDIFKRSVPPPVSKWWSNMGINYSFSNTNNTKNYHDNVWVYGAIFLISQEIARTKFYLSRENAKGEMEKKTEHQCLETLNMPLPKAKGRAHLTRMRLMMITVQHLLLQADAYWVMDKRLRGLGGAPQMLFPLSPRGVTPEIDKEGLISKYVYRTPQTTIEYPAEDVVHFSLPDPEDWYQGMSSMKPSRWALSTYKEADELNLARFVNMAVPAGLLETEQDVNAKERKKLVNQFLAVFKGSKNAQKIAALPKGLKFNKVQETNSEMQYKEGKEFNRDEILAGLRTPIELLGKTESQTRANAEVSNYVFQRFNILPLLTMITDTLTHDYMPAFPNVDGWEFAFDDPVPENKEQNRLDDELLMKFGAMTIDELRGKRGLDPLGVKGITDVPLLDLNKMPMGADFFSDDIKPKPGDEDDA